VRILAIDPGREKCGAAVCEPAKVLAHRVVRTRDLTPVVAEWVAAFHVDLVVVGNRTGSGEVLALLTSVAGGLKVPVKAVEEQDTTLAARRRYFRDHPPRGWRRLLPLSLQLPPEPYDDYAAVEIAESYLEK
jgi:RNase H-fold protein (predicted Holliday junction resolvase)